MSRCMLTLRCQREVRQKYLWACHHTLTQTHPEWSDRSFSGQVTRHTHPEQSDRSFPGPVTRHTHPAQLQRSSSGLSPHTLEALQTLTLHRYREVHLACYHTPTHIQSLSNTHPAQSNRSFSGPLTTHTRPEQSHRNFSGPVTMYACPAQPGGRSRD